MPQQLKTKTITIDGEGLPDLTPEQQTFLTELLKGETASDAFRKAKPDKTLEWAPQSIWVAASRMRASKPVQQWLAAAREAGLAKIRLDIETHTAELDRLKRSSEQAGNYGAAVTAEKALGQVAGLYVERHEDVTPQVDLDAIRRHLPDILRALGVSNELASACARDAGPAGHDEKEERRGTAH